MWLGACLMVHHPNENRLVVLCYRMLDSPARLSGIEFSQSLPGIRGSQYKVKGVSKCDVRRAGTKEGQKQSCYRFRSVLFTQKELKWWFHL